MIPGIWTYVATGLVAAALASTGTWRVQEWRWGAKEAQRLAAERVADEARQSDAKQQRQFNDTASGRHAATVATLSNKLGDARAQIATLSTSRQCLDARTVGMLNNLGTTGGLGLRTTARQSAGAAAATAADQADGSASSSYASERDTADWIAICRTRHDELANQVNEILDIEDRRQAGAK